MLSARSERAVRTLITCLHAHSSSAQACDFLPLQARMSAHLLVNANHCVLRHTKEQQRRARLSKPARSVGIQLNRVRRGRHGAYGMLVLAGARLSASLLLWQVCAICLS